MLFDARHACDLATVCAFALFQVAAGQDRLLIQDIHHPPAAPDFDHHRFDREILIADSQKIVDELRSANLIPVDTLIDPKGRVVFDPRKRNSRKKLEQDEEEELLNSFNRSNLKSYDRNLTLLLSTFGCVCIVACGVIPAFVVPIEGGEFLQTESGKRNLNLLLSFAVGSLLGDVFLHLLPETWSENQDSMLYIGFWTNTGLLLCFLIEKCCATTEGSRHRVCAIMSLVGNIADNFTHGLAVGGSFLVGIKFGVLTTFAVVIHELPHELSDFAILLRGNFDRWSAVKMQLVTSIGGIFGAFTALCFNSGDVMSKSALWILPFTAGGFLNIALAQILPELLREKSAKQSFLQMVFLLAGLFVMALLNQFHH